MKIYKPIYTLFLLAMACSPSNKMINNSKVYQTHSFGFSQAIETDGFLFFSGQVGWNTDYQITGSDFKSQVEQSFLNIENLLEGAQSSFQNVVLMRFYVKALNTDKRDIIGEQLKALYSEEYKPATTLLGIETLAREDIQIEIEVIAKITN